MKPSTKKRIPFTIVVIPYVFLIIYYIDNTFFNKTLFFFFPLGLITLLPFSAFALGLKYIWKLDYEDGTDKGDALTLFFGTLAFMGVVCGIAALFYLLVIK